MAGNKKGGALLFWTLIVRIAAFIPIIIYGGIVVDSAKRINKHPEIRRAPYNPIIVPSSVFSAIFGCFCIPWQLIALAFTGRCEGLLITGLVELFVFAGMVVSVVLQSMFIPHVPTKCSVVAQTWQVPAETPSIFTLMADLPTSNVSSIHKCEDYQYQWSLGVGNMGLYGATAIFTLILFRRIDPTEQKPANWAGLAKGVGFTIFCPLFIVVLVVQKIVQLFIPYTRCLIRSYQKQKCHEKHQELIEEHLSLRTRHPADIRASGIACCPLATVSEVIKEKNSSVITTFELKQMSRWHYLPTEILNKICRELHHTDLVNWSLASKAIRRRLCNGLGGCQEGDQEFRKQTCSGEVKSECWTCGIQVCEACTQRVKLEEPQPSAHSRYCRLVCRSCYIKRLLMAGREHEPMHSLVCICEEWLTDEEITGSGPGRPSINVTICQGCFESLDPKGMIETRRCRDKQSVQALTKDRSSCGDCHRTFASVPGPKSVLRSGAKWWICERCQRECTSHLHPQLWEPCTKRDAEA